MDLIRRNRLAIIAFITIGLLFVVVLGGLLYARFGDRLLESRQVQAAENTIAASAPASINFISPVFAEGGAIPSEYTCDSDNRSPALQWQNLPPGTVSLVLIMDDPDARIGSYVHWVLYDIPPEVSDLPSGNPTNANPSSGGTQGLNDDGELGYTGPCPPSGEHNYIFKLYALDTQVGLPAGATRSEILEVIVEHVLARGELTATYAR